MSAVRCENCKGTGWEDTYLTYPSHCDLPPEKLGKRRCTNCGGSGCKWEEDGR